MDYILTIIVENQNKMNKVDKLTHRKEAYYLVIQRLKIKPEYIKYRVIRKWNWEVGRRKIRECCFHYKPSTYDFKKIISCITVVGKKYKGIGIKFSNWQRE